VSSSTLYEPAAGVSFPFADEPAGAGRRHARAGAAVSVVLHGALFAALYLVWSHAPEPPPRPRTIELTLTRPAAPQPLVALQTPQPVASPQPIRPTPQQQVRPVVPQPQHANPVMHAVPAATSTTPATPVAQAVSTPSAAPALANAPSVPQSVAAPSAPLAAPETATPSKPHVIDSDGIPSDYVAKIFERINRYAEDSYPRAARLRHEEGRVAYKLTLDAEGHLVHLDITPSGSDLLDAAAREAIKAAAPFPKPPDLGANAYRLAGAIVYQLTD
jgi:periplasmic protein TonB